MIWMILQRDSFSSCSPISKCFWRTETNLLTKTNLLQKVSWKVSNTLILLLLTMYSDVKPHRTSKGHINSQRRNLHSSASFLLFIAVLRQSTSWLFKRFQSNIKLVGLQNIPTHEYCNNPLLASSVYLPGLRATHEYCNKPLLTSSVYLSGLPATHCSLFSLHAISAPNAILKIGNYTIGI